MGGTYDVAQVCLNGHVVNSRVRSNPIKNTKYCAQCGERTISACEKCSESIRGQYKVPGISVIGGYGRPAYCHDCGSAFPWTDRALDAAITIVIESGELDEGDQQSFRANLHEIVKDTAQAQVAAGRITRLLKKAGDSVAGAVRDIVVDIASETAKKIIWPEK